MDKYKKLLLSLKYYCLGKEYHLALKALKYTLKYHNGLRKDKVTPESQHQLEIALYIITLKAVANEELAIVAALLHDLVEDTEVSKEELISIFGESVYDIVWRLTKKHKGVNKSTEEYYATLATCPVASVVKGSDRIHNVQSMVGVFSKEKQIKYLQEVDDFVLPMIKEAKTNFPEQTHAYFNISNFLKSQSSLIRSFSSKADKEVK